MCTLYCSNIPMDSWKNTKLIALLTVYHIQGYKCLECRLVVHKRCHKLIKKICGEQVVRKLLPVYVIAISTKNTLLLLKIHGQFRLFLRCMEHWKWNLSTFPELKALDFLSLEYYDLMFTNHMLTLFGSYEWEKKNLRKLHFMNYYLMI